MDKKNLSDKNYDNLEIKYENLIKRFDSLEERPALNGGFDRLVQSVTKIETKMENNEKNSTRIEEQMKRIEEKMDRMFDPEEGIFSRLKDVERNVNKVNDEIHELNQTEHELDKKITNIEKSTEEITVKIKTLKTISGENFEEIQSAIKTKQNFYKGFWLILSGFCAAVGKLLWDLLSH